jgi:hypothetical protein
VNLSASDKENYAGIIIEKIMKNFLILLVFFFTAACNLDSEATPIVTKAQTAEGMPALTAAMMPATQTPQPSSTPIPTLTHTPQTTILEVTVWTKDPLIPILNYHRFLPDHYDQSTGMKMRLSDFKSHLQKLYDAGYSLILLDDLLSGNLNVPAGHRPLVLCIDDAYFADQLYLDDQGELSPLSGVGVLSAFSRERPEFGFAVAMFANFGDK